MAAVGVLTEVTRVVRLQLRDHFSHVVQRVPLRQLEVLLHDGWRLVVPHPDVLPQQLQRPNVIGVGVLRALDARDEAFHDPVDVDLCSFGDGVLHQLQRRLDLNISQ